ncbi:MAG TPA: hypothetical protein VFA86_00040 [Gammaproteobacteria bacterium]|nr:hypothetical protein [Gammaproteobacteria bacterium]
MTKRTIRTLFHRTGFALSGVVLLAGVGFVGWMVYNAGADILAELAEPSILTRIVLVLFVAFAGVVWGIVRVTDLAGWAAASMGEADPQGAPGAPWEDRAYRRLRKHLAPADARLALRLRRWAHPLGWIAATAVAWLVTLASVQLGHAGNVGVLIEFPLVFVLVLAGACCLPRRLAGNHSRRPPGARHVPVRP